MVRGSIQADITIINIYAPNIRAPRYLQQILIDLKVETDGNKVRDVVDRPGKRIAYSLIDHMY